MTELRPPDTSPVPLKLRIEDYHLLDQSGAFAPYAKTELINGVILAVNAQYSRHARAQRAMFRALDEACRALGLECVFELSVELGAHSEPRPDILVARALPETGPVPIADVLLVVEIGDSSLDVDLLTKAPLYAAAGLPEYWVVDLEHRVVHLMASPNPDGYAKQDKVAFGAVVEAVTVAGLRVETGGL